LEYSIIDASLNYNKKSVRQKTEDSYRNPKTENSQETRKQKAEKTPDFHPTGDPPQDGQFSVF